MGLAGRCDREFRRAELRARQRVGHKPTVSSQSYSALGDLADMETAEIVAADLRDALLALKAKGLAALRRRYGDGESVQRIAAEVGLQAQAVRQRLARSTLRLRIALGRHRAAIAAMGPAGRDRLIQAVGEALQSPARVGEDPRSEG